jgi:pimeloyl-ACP methyl ester carboxylesterase
MVNKKEVILNPYLSFDVTLNTEFERYVPIVFLHGFKGFKDWGHYPLMAEDLAKKGFAVFKLNFSKNGVIPPNLNVFNDLEAFGNNTLSQEIADVNRLIHWMQTEFSIKEKLNWQKLTLMGHSRGGATALIYSSLHIEIKYLITLSAVADLGRMLNPSQVNEWIANGVMYTPNMRTKQNMPLKIKLRNDYYEHINLYEVLKAAKKIKIPALIIHAQNDEAVPLSDALLLKQSIINAQLVVISNANHTFNGMHPYKESQLPDKVNEVLNNIINFIK